MDFKDMKDKIQATLDETKNALILEEEFYTIKEVAKLFRTSSQHVGRLLKNHNIEILNIALTGAKRSTYRIKKSEVLRLKETITTSFS